MNYPILEICRDLSDEDHPLKCEEIVDRLNNDYGFHTNIHEVMDVIHQMNVLSTCVEPDTSGGGTTYRYCRPFAYEDIKTQLIHLIELESISHTQKAFLTRKIIDKMSKYQKEKILKDVKELRDYVFSDS